MEIRVITGTPGTGPSAGAPARATFAEKAPKITSGQKAVGTQILQQRSRQARTSELVSAITPEMVASAITAANAGNIGKIQGLYMRMAAADARYSGFIRALHAGLLANPLRVFPSPTKTPASREYAQIATDMLFMFQHSSLIRRLAKPYLTGVVAYEPLWTLAKGRDGKDRVLPYDLKVVPPTLYKMDMEKDSDTFGELMIISEEEKDGTPVSEYPWGRVFVVTDGAEDGWLDQGGAARSCLFWFLAKTKNAGWWAEFNEIYGEPHRVAYFDESTTDEELTVLEGFLKNVGRAAYAMMPAGIDLEVLSTDKAGTIKTYEDIITLSNTEMAIAVLGQTQTSDGGENGSYAKASIHMGIQYQILKAIGLMAKETLDDLLLATIAFNVGPNFEPADLPEIKLVVPNPEEKEVKARVFKMAQEIGLSIPAQHARDELGIPEPGEEDEILVPTHNATESETEDGRDYDTEDDSRSTDRKEGDLSEPTD